MLARTRRFADILALAADLSAFPVAALKGPARKRPLFMVRFAAWTIGAEHGHSLPRMGMMTGRDHSSVCKGIKKAAIFAARDMQFALFIAELRNEADKCVNFVEAKEGYTPAYRAACVARFEFLAMNGSDLLKYDIGTVSRERPPRTYTNGAPLVFKVPVVVAPDPTTLARNEFDNSDERVFGQESNARKGMMLGNDAFLKALRA